MLLCKKVSFEPEKAPYSAAYFIFRILTSASITGLLTRRLEFGVENMLRHEVRVCSCSLPVIGLSLRKDGSHPLQSVLTELSDMALLK